MVKGEVSLTDERRCVRSNAADAGMKLEPAPEAVFIDLLARGASKADFHGRLKDEANETGVVNAKGVTEIVWLTIVGCDHSGEGKGREFSTTSSRGDCLAGCGMNCAEGNPRKKRSVAD